jgi:transcription elongation factor Elf1
VPVGHLNTSLIRDGIEMNDNGTNAFEADVVWDCVSCEEENSESIQANGNYAWVECRHCGQSQEIAV